MIALHNVTQALFGIAREPHKSLITGRFDFPRSCGRSRNITNFFGEVSSGFDRVALDQLASVKVADSLARIEALKEQRIGSERSGAPCGLEDQPSNFAGTRQQRHMARGKLDGGGAHPLRHEAL
jgi:hypothetical protein